MVTARDLGNLIDRETFEQRHEGKEGDHRVCHGQGFKVKKQKMLSTGQEHLGTFEKHMKTYEVEQRE